MSIPLPPTIGIVAAGAMGSAIAHKLIQTGSCTILTNLDGRSDATRKRAHEAGMEDVPLVDMTRQAKWVLSILPPRDAFAFAERLLDAERLNDGARDRGPLVFVDCNAVNPQTVKRIAGLFVGSPRVKFIDAGIIGGPPKAGYDPTFYASVDVGDTGILDEFVRLSEYGLKIKPLTGEDAGIGDASALKMSYAVSHLCVGLYCFNRMRLGYDKGHDGTFHSYDPRYAFILFAMIKNLNLGALIDR